MSIFTNNQTRSQIGGNQNMTTNNIFQNQGMQQGNLFNQNQGQNQGNIFNQQNFPQQQQQQPFQQNLQQNQVFQNQQNQLFMGQNQPNQSLFNQQQQMHPNQPFNQNRGFNSDIEQLEQMFKQYRIQPMLNQQSLQSMDFKVDNAYANLKPSQIPNNQYLLAMTNIQKIYDQTSNNIQKFKSDIGNINKIIINNLHEEQLKYAMKLKKQIIVQKGINNQVKDLQQYTKMIKDEYDRIYEFVATLKNNKVQMQQIPTSFILQFTKRLELQLKIITQQTQELEYMLKNTKTNKPNKEQEQLLAANVLEDIYLYFNKIVQDVFLYLQNYSDVRKKYDILTFYDHGKQANQEVEKRFKEENQAIIELDNILHKLINKVAQQNELSQLQKRTTNF